MAKQNFTPEEVVAEAWNVLGRTFTNPMAKKDPEELRLGRIAMGTVSAWSRMLATESAREQVRAMVADRLASENGDQFRRYYLGTDSPKALPPARKGKR